MLTEAAGPVAERDYPTLRAHTGTAPVTQRSGKRAFLVRMRYACEAATPPGGVSLVANQYPARCRARGAYTRRSAAGDACKAFFELTLRAGRIALRRDMAPPR